MANGRTIPRPGFYMVRTSKGSGVVKFDRAGITDPKGVLSGADSAVFFLGDTEAAAKQNFQRGVNALGTLLLFEQPGGIDGIVHQASTTGAALYTPATAGITQDWTPTYGLAAVLAIGGLIAAPLLGAGAVVGGEGAAAGAGAAAAGAEGSAAGGAAAGGAAGGAASAAKSAVGRILGGSVGKAVAGASVLSLFTTPSLWKGIGLVLAGAILVLLALMQFTGSSPVSVARRFT